MFLKKENFITEALILSGISLYAYILNWYSGNLGVMPIDSFGFFDTGYSITQGHLPIRDFWIFTGLVVDYMGAVFISIFGNNWNSHIAHSSFMNIVATIGLYFFLKEYNLKIFHRIFYCLSFATLCYPVAGTPFAYLHAYIFSLLSIFCLIVAIKNKNKILWFIFPILCLLAFLSMQTPTAYILIILFTFLFFHFKKEYNFKNLSFFALGCISSVLLFSLFIFITKTPITNFIYQYILFPLTIGEGRLTSQETAYISLIDQINFKRLIGEFKFIHIFLFPLTYIAIRKINFNSPNYNILNFTIICSALAFFFNQLITANQIYIFSLIPILASVFHINLINLKINYKYIYIIFIIVLFSTAKFHLRFNVDRKFHDLENVNKINAIKANKIHESFNNLKWISKFDNPENELIVIEKAMNVINNDQRTKSLLTHYQFISTFLDEPLYLLNRWYLWDDNTHPTENHKYFKFYKSMINKNINNNNIEVIYLLGQDNEILFKNIENYFVNICFESKTIIEKRFSSHRIITCPK